MLHISSCFESGNIDVVDLTANRATLKIRKDSASDHKQWFYFAVQGGQGQPCELEIVNAGESSYPDGWKDYQARASYDGDTWFCVPTVYDGKTLKIMLTPEFNNFYIAYFAPYPYERLLKFLGQIQSAPNCELIPLGATCDKRMMHLVKVSSCGRHAMKLHDRRPTGPSKMILDPDARYAMSGRPNELGPDDSSAISGRRNVWIIARQHPGESMGSWFAEGLIEKLLDAHNNNMRALLAQTTFYIVPMMNPDGVARGHIRTNAKGVDLNRAWQNTTLEMSPEAYLVRQKMQETGVDAFFDIHGDEATPYIFLAGNEGNPSYNQHFADLENRFKQAFFTTSADFQDKIGYPKDEKGKADLGMASNFVGETYQCLGYTLEMPFKDNAHLPDPVYGWSPKRCKNLAEEMLEAIRLFFKE